MKLFFILLSAFWIANHVGDLLRLALELIFNLIYRITNFRKSKPFKYYFIHYYPFDGSCFVLQFVQRRHSPYQPVSGVTAYCNKVILQSPKITKSKLRL